MMRNQLFRIFSMVALTTIAVPLSNYIPNAVAQTQNESVIADLGFRPKTNGFSFENYGKERGVVNLSASEMQRMFGNQICANKKGGNCILTSTAKKAMKALNKAMNGGHCEGMAVLSLLLYRDPVMAGEYGRAFDLVFKGNQKLQHEIAYWFATQIFAPTTANRIDDKSPAEVLDILLKALKPNADVTQTYTMAIFQPEFKNGHAITPYAVVDKGSGLYAVLVYDNNHPKEKRHLEINRNTNTWSYQASSNPSEKESLYEGTADSKTLILTPTGLRLGLQECSFCGKQSKARSSQPKNHYNSIRLNGNADLLVSNGKSKIGYENGKFVNAFPGAIFNPQVSSNLWKDDNEPIYNVPINVPTTVLLQAYKPDQNPVEVVMMGEGYYLGLAGINLIAGQSDRMQFSANGLSLSYTPTRFESPNIQSGLSTLKDDYDFELQGVEVDAGATLTSTLEQNKGHLAVKLSNTKQNATFNLLMSRIDEKSEQQFLGQKLTLKSGDTLYIDYASWAGDKTRLKVEVDKFSDGIIDNTILLRDQN